MKTDRLLAVIARVAVTFLVVLSTVSSAYNFSRFEGGSFMVGSMLAAAIMSLVTYVAFTVPIVLIDILDKE